MVPGLDGIPLGFADTHTRERSRDAMTPLWTNLTLFEPVHDSNSYCAKRFPPRRYREPRWRLIVEEKAFGRPSEDSKNVLKVLNSSSKRRFQACLRDPSQTGTHPAPIGGNSESVRLRDAFFATTPNLEVRALACTIRKGRALL